MLLIRSLRGCDAKVWIETSNLKSEAAWGENRLQQGCHHPKPTMNTQVYILERHGQGM